MFITISRQVKNKIWGYSVPLNNKSGIIGSANGIRYFQTKRNYYYSFKDNKVHFQNMKTDNASYDYLVDLYFEVLPGIFSFYSIATENSISDKLESGSTKVKSLTDDFKTEFRNVLELTN